MSSGDIVIVGGGLAALRTGQGLRDLGFEGSIVLVSDEQRLPYDRPPLSKNYLLGLASDEDISLLGAERLADLGVEVRLGARAQRLDREAGRVELADGASIGYGKLVVATGARAIRLPAFEGLDGVVYLRTAEDAEELRDVLAGRPAVGIVGGGFIGLEVASVARRLGCDVTVIEMAPAPLTPVLGADLGAFVQQWHEEQGVMFRCGTVVAGAQGAGRIEALVLADGSTVPVDVAVVGVGVTPNVDWLVGSGLEIHRGLVCDEHGRTSDPAVLAVGDVACRHVDGECRLTGHWTAASDQAGIVAAALLEQPVETSFLQEGYFWSDQFDSRLQFAGAVGARPQLTLASGELGDRKFVALLGDRDEPTAVFAMNSPREFVRASRALPSHPCTGRRIAF
jgi:3-phenylpropionate/trans-cinnamate dioxygenase ferredoxin reductase subunit